jgi:hypothetical protein
MKNSADKGTVRRRGSGFLSAKDFDRIGYGLSSVCAIAKRYNGETAYKFDENSGIFTSTVLLILKSL